MFPKIPSRRHHILCGGPPRLEESTRPIHLFPTSNHGGLQHIERSLCQVERVEAANSLVFGRRSLFPGLTDRRLFQRSGLCNLVPPLPPVEEKLTQGRGHTEVVAVEPALIPERVDEAGRSV